jgi:Protein kinase domain
MTLGQYRITRELGLGGMGAVYSAEHTLLGRVAAVKVLRPELSQDREIVNRFFNEARAAAAIRHPSIVEIYDFGWHADGSAYLVMEHLQGESLATRLERGPMEAARVMVIVRQIAGALAAAHQHGIIHRDLKPDNLFLVPDPEVTGGERIKLLDFGIAKLVADNDQHHRTRPGTIMGTPTYMAPEQCLGAAIDHRADLYSLGCIMFELCAGRPPFVEMSMSDLLSAQVHMPPPALSSVIAGIPLALEALVQRLLVKEVQHRMQSAEAVVQAVDAATGSAYRTGMVVLAADEVGAPPLPLPPTVPAIVPAGVPRVPVARRTHQRYLGLGVVVAICAASAVVALGAGRRWLERRTPAPEVAPDEVRTPPRAPGIALAPPPLAPPRPPEIVASLPIDAGVLDASRILPVRAAAVAPRTGRVPGRTPDELPSSSPSAGGSTAGSSALIPPVLPTTTAADIVQRYTEVGHALKILDADRGSGVTEDLWPVFRIIRINEAIADPQKREEAEVLLRRLQDLIAARSR